MPLEANVLIVTVTKVESQAVIQAFEQFTGHQSIAESINARVYFNLGEVNGAQVFLTQSEMGSGGLDAALLTVCKGIDTLSPAAVIMVGIAFGINEEKHSIGDILVAEQLRLYDLQRMGTQDGQPQIILRGDIALRRYVRTLLKCSINTIAEAIKLIPPLLHPILEYEPPIFNLVEVWRISR